MELVKNSNFCELSSSEMDEVNGGGIDVIGGACAIVTLWSGSLVGGFIAGRAFVRDIKNKFFK